MVGRTLMIVGPSQVGKSTAIRELVDRHNYRFVKTCTTRAPRVNELDGEDYDFLTQQRFRELIMTNELIDWDFFLGCYGGIYRRSFLQRTKQPRVLHVLARMALRIEQRHRWATAVFLAPEDMSLVYDRIRATFTDDQIVKARCAHAEEEMLHSLMFRNVIRIEQHKTVSDIAAEIDTVE